MRRAQPLEPQQTNTRRLYDYRDQSSKINYRTSDRVSSGSLPRPPECSGAGRCCNTFKVSYRLAVFDYGSQKLIIYCRLQTKETEL